jgi:MoaA/NifB/PqqE/SkfB family radical SAM enzyme
MHLGVNDFSISLDSGCCSVGKKLTGGIEGAWEKVVDNIREISKISYVTVGMVFTEDNIGTATEDIKFADSLGVADIRIISSSQYQNQLIIF